MKKIKVAIIGTGNIGTDLLMKVRRSAVLECGMFTGRHADSSGIRMARSMGVNCSSDSISAIRHNPSCCDIVFDATSAKTHLEHAPILKKLKKFTIDLTPSRYGKMCIPVMNLNDCLGTRNVNLITCSGQAAIPVIGAIMKVHPETQYIELVASIASKSAGPGTRANIDEFTQATRDAIISFTGVKNAKAIIVLNPAEPPVIMHNTVYAQIPNPKLDKLHREVKSIADKIKKYVPGYEITMMPVSENNRVTTMIEVVGRGDFLPKYSGNLDIMTSAAVNVAETYAKSVLAAKSRK